MGRPTQDGSDLLAKVVHSQFSANDRWLEGGKPPLPSRDAEVVLERSLHTPGGLRYLKPRTRRESRAGQQEQNTKYRVSA